VAIYVDRILRATKSVDLPVQAPHKFELVINLKTAKALGIDVSPALLAQADEVMEQGRFLVLADCVFALPVAHFRTAGAATNTPIALTDVRIRGQSRHAGTKPRRLLVYPSRH
jgi:hypothetical protein